MPRIDKDFSGAKNISQKDIEQARVRDNVGLTPRKALPVPISDSSFPPPVSSGPLSVPLRDLAKRKILR